MKNQVTENNKMLASLIHLFVLSKYFIPLGNFIIPITVWVIHKDKPFVEKNGRNAINFQMSVFLYILLLAFVVILSLFITIGDFNKFIDALYTNTFVINSTTFSQHFLLIVIAIIALVIITSILLLEIYAVIMAAVYASQGKLYPYPFSIPFLKKTQNESTALNLSKNEHTN